MSTRCTTTTFEQGKELAKANAESLCIVSTTQKVLALPRLESLARYRSEDDTILILELILVMRHTSGLVTTYEALQRVFIGSIPPAAAKVNQCMPRNRSKTLPWLLRSTSISCRSQQSCHASTSRMVSCMPIIHDNPHRRYSTDRPPRDDEIKAFKVHLKREDGRLSDPLPTYEVLKSRRRDEQGRLTEYLQQVVAEAVAEGRYYPICRMVDRAEERGKQKMNKEKKTQKKQLEINWIMSDNDLSHRMGRFKEFLEKGHRVEIVFDARRKRGWKDRREPSHTEVQNTLNRINGIVAEVEGARVWKAAKGLEGGQMTLSFEGKVKKQQVAETVQKVSSGA